MEPRRQIPDPTYHWPGGPSADDDPTPIESALAALRIGAILAAAIIKTLDKKGLSVRKAQSLTGIDAGDFSRVRNADFRRISVERFMAMINGLGSRVEVAVTLRRAQTRHAAAVA